MAKAVGLILFALLLPLGCAANSLSASATSCASFGDSDSRPEVGLRTLVDGEELRRLAATRQEIRVAGVLWHGRKPLRQLCMYPEHVKDRPSPGCVQLAFDWEAVGLDEEAGDRILAQWTGRRIEVSGLVEPGAVPVGYGHLLVDAATLLDEREVNSPSYCPSHSGPLQPSADELWSRKMRLGASCRDDWWSYFDDGYARACLEEYEPAIWLRTGKHLASLRPQLGDRRLAFDVPSPFAGRDIWEFAPLEKNIYLLTLVDGRLFAVVDGDTRALEGPRVDQLSRTPESNVVYYRLRTESPEGESTVVELRAIDANLSPWTLWKSDTERLNHIDVRSGWPLRLFVEGKSGDRLLIQDENGDWSVRSRDEDARPARDP